MKRHDPAVKITDSNEAIALLKEGNERFVSGKLMPKDFYAESLKAGATQQSPFAAILTCADSRTSPEIFFDQGTGNIFVCRNAGNFADETACGSIDFAAGVLGVKVVVVVGHNQCGAVINAAKGTGGLPPELTSVLGQIKKHFPALSEAEVAGANQDGAAVKANVMASVEKIKNLALVKQSGIPVLGAYYDVGTGKVTWY